MKDGGPAFPIPLAVSDSDGDTMIDPAAGHHQINHGLGGMSLRDYFAAAVLQGLLSRETGYSPSDKARIAYDQADAMLAAREAKS